jgi:coproporphyrinogen III oxidase-like Fe-S oxidoreductase
MSEKIYFSTAEPLEPNDATAEKVIKELRLHNAMPFLEIAAVTGSGIISLAKTVEKLEKQDYIKVNGKGDPSTMVLSLSGVFPG